MYIVNLWGPSDAYDIHRFARANSAWVTNKINELARTYHSGGIRGRCNSPPHATKADAEVDEEHFDGKTTE